MTTACIRCGKERLFSKSWKEQIGTALSTVTLYVCPDAECQKIVESQIQDKKDKLQLIQDESLKRKELFKEKRSAAKK